MKLLLTAILVAAVSVSILLFGCSSNESADQTASETTIQSQETSVAETTAEPFPEQTPTSETQGQTLQMVRIFGPVTRSGDDLIIDNQSGVSSSGEIVLHISDTTLILDATDGFPVSIDDIKDGDVIYAYIGPAMTLSLPPQTTASVIFTAAPADSKVPDYVTVASVEEKDGGYRLTAADGSVFSIPADCPIVPFLTRQMVALSDLAEGRTCIIWSDDSNTASKIVLFNETAPGDESAAEDSSPAESAEAGTSAGTDGSEADGSETDGGETAAAN